jgi:hypothetical protein
LIICPFVRAETSSIHVDFGIYYYLWHGPGLGSSHWNDTQSNAVVDTPILGYYSSNDTDIMKQHLYWIKEMGFTFIIASTWEINGYTWNNTQLLYQSLQETGYDLKICVLIEPFNGTGSYDWAYLYNQIYDRFYASYAHLTFKLSENFLLLVLEQCFSDYQYGNATINLPEDSRFTVRIVGSHEAQSDWFYGDVMGRVNNNDLSGRVNTDGHINIFPRFDEWYLGRPNPVRIDFMHGQQLYQRFWDLALSEYKKGNIYIVIVTSFNEHHERHAIEPRQDATSVWTDSMKLYSITKTNIAKFQTAQVAVQTRENFSLLIPTVIGICLLFTAIGLVKYYVV